MHVILSEGRQIESRRQLAKTHWSKKQIGNVNRNACPWTTTDARAGAFEKLDLPNWTWSQARKVWKRYLIRKDVDWERERNELGRERRRKGGRKEDMKHSQGRVAAWNKTGWSPASSNVTQAAIHKETWREQITKTKKYIYKGATLVNKRANWFYTLAGSPAWGLVLNPLVAYTSTTVYIWCNKCNLNLNIKETFLYVSLLWAW